MIGWIGLAMAGIGVLGLAWVVIVWRAVDGSGFWYDAYRAQRGLSPHPRAASPDRERGA